MGVHGEVVHHRDRSAGISRDGRPHFVEVVVRQRRLDAEGHVVSLCNDLALRPASRLSKQCNVRTVEVEARGVGQFLL